MAAITCGQAGSYTATCWITTYFILVSRIAMTDSHDILSYALPVLRWAFYQAGHLDVWTC